MKELADQVDDGELKRAEAIILSMTVGGAAESRYHPWVPPPADRQRLGYHDQRHQRVAQGFRGRPQDDADDDGRQTNAGHDEDAGRRRPEG